MLTPASSALAAWDPGGSLVAQSPGILGQASWCANGMGGLYATWTYGVQPTIVSATELMLDGSRPAEWPITGRELFATHHQVTAALCAPDGASGQFIAGLNILLATADPTRPFVVTHCASSGALAPGWPDSGLIVGDTPHPKINARMIADGAGGTYLVWLDAVGSDLSSLPFRWVVEPRVLRLDGDGVAPGWPDSGLVLEHAPSAAVPSAWGALDAVADGAGGIYVAWSDSTDGVGDVYVQHVEPTGALAAGWPEGGRSVSASPALRSLQGLAVDVTGGALLSWHEYTGGHYVAFAARIDVDGSTAPGWPATGCVASPPDASAGPIVSDGLGGAIVGWQTLTRDVYASHVTAAGVLDPAWPSGGVPIATTPDDESYRDALADGAGGAYLLWVRESWVDLAPQDDVMATHLTPSGAVAAGWPAGGLTVSDLPGRVGPEPAAMLSDGHGGAIAVWRRTPLTTGSAEVRAMHFGTDGIPTTSVPPATAVARLAVAPSPFTSSTEISFSLHRVGAARVEVFDIGGRRVRTLLAGALPAGVHTRAWDGRDDDGVAVPSGLYFVRARAEGLERTARVVRVR